MIGQTINGNTARLHILDLKWDVVIPFRIEHFAELSRKLWRTKFGNAVLDCVGLSASWITLQSKIQEVFPFLILLAIQVCQSQINLSASIQVGIIVTKPHQNIFRIALFRKRIQPEHQRRLSQTMPAIDIDDILITGYTLISPFIFCEVTQASLPNEIKHIVPKDAIVLALLCQRLCIGKFHCMKRLCILQSLGIEFGRMTTVFIVSPLLNTIGVALRLTVITLRTPCITDEQTAHCSTINGLSRRVFLCQHLSLELPPIVEETVGRNVFPLLILFQDNRQSLSRSLTSLSLVLIALQHTLPNSSLQVALLIVVGIFPIHRASQALLLDVGTLHGNRAWTLKANRQLAILVSQERCL